MFLDIGWPELMLIGAVALVVIGPKDLPAALKVAGYWLRKARTMSREFHSSVEQMIREAELDEVQRELKKATEIDLDHELNKIMEPADDSAIKSPPPDVPDYLDTTPASALPPPAETATTDEPELPFPPQEPVQTAEAEPVQHDPEPARAAEPPKS